ncbi:MAG: hypothetical protein KC731_22620 [Myxococcales bacterium]|nr:hypothetical protein [Myxococcales bacterium]
MDLSSTRARHSLVAALISIATPTSRWPPTEPLPLPEGPTELRPDGATPPPPTAAPEPPPLPVSPVAPEAAPTEPPTRREVDPHAADQLLREGLREHTLDDAHRLPAATNVAHALAEAVRHHTPPVARTWYEARLTSDGELLGIDLVDYDHRSGARSRWEDAAAEALADLRDERFRVPTSLFPQGVAIRIRVDQSLEKPSGSGREHAATPARKARPAPRVWPWNPKLEPEPDLHARLQPVPIETGGPLGTVAIEFPTCITTSLVICPPSGLFVFDVSDIGAHPVRVVHTHVEVTPIDREAGPRQRQSGSRQQRMPTVRLSGSRRSTPI